MSLNGDHSHPHLVVLEVIVDDTGLEDTPISATVKMQQECPHCGKLLKTERHEGSGESASEAFSRATDKLQSVMLEHFEAAHDE